MKKSFTLAEVFLQHLKGTRKAAFTLAEVLVTMGVIGVVSAMTIPTLMNNYQKQVYVTSLHKVYNETNQALVQIMTDKNSDNLVEAGLTSQDNVDEWVEKYFKYTTKCASTDWASCFAPLAEYDKINTNTSGANLNVGITTTYVLASGASVRFLSSNDGNQKIMNLVVDTNGKKGPNILGRDFFGIAIYKNGLLDDYSANTDAAPLTPARRTAIYSQCTDQTSQAWGCFGKILNDGWQMTY